MTKSADVLAYTVSYGERRGLARAVPDMRATAGEWFDWAVWLGAPSASALADAEALLHHPERRGIQRLEVWAQNRGQHHATRSALALARAEGYRWLLRLDDDIASKTKGWLKKMLQHLEVLERLTGARDRVVAGPRIVGLQHPPQPVGSVQRGQPFQADLMPLLGGACRLHPVALLQGYEPDLLAPLGRQDPQSLADYLFKPEVEGLMLRFPSIRVQHHTARLEQADSPEQSVQRRMGHYWPYLGPS